MSNFLCSLEYYEYKCAFSVAPLTSDMPSRKSVALLPSNGSFSTDVWYDKVAIFSTRGYTNIYHNTEWIANFYHIATNIEKFPLVLWIIDYKIVFCIYHSQSEICRRRSSFQLGKFVLNTDFEHVSQRYSTKIHSLFFILHKEQSYLDSSRCMFEFLCSE